MAICFARFRAISRGRGGNSLRSLAYISRTGQRDERTDVPYDFSDRTDLLAPAVTVVPDHAPEDLQDPSNLWNAIEKETGHPRGVVALEVVLAIPDDVSDEGSDHLLPTAEVVHLVEDFVGRVVMPAGLAVSWALHGPHGEIDEPNDEFAEMRHNRHAHVLVSPREVTPVGISEYRSYALEGGFRNKLADPPPWPTLWTRVQNAMFLSRGWALRVRPTAPVPQRHEGPRRRRSTTSASKPRTSRHRKIEGLILGNAQAELRNREWLTRLETLVTALPARPFTRAEIESLVARYGSSSLGPEGVGRLVDTALSSPNVNVHCDPVTGTPTGWFSAAAVRELEAEALAMAAEHFPDFVRRDEDAVVRCLARLRTPRALVQPAYSVLRGRGICIVDALDGDTLLLRRHLAKAGRLLGLNIVTVAHRANTVAPIVDGQHEDEAALWAMTLTPDSALDADLVIMDRADATEASVLRTIIAAAAKGGAQVLLLRRHEDPVLWPRNPLLDVFARAFGSTPMGTPREKSDWRDALAAADVRAAHLMEEARRIVWAENAGTVEAAVIAHCRAAPGAGRPVVLVGDEDRRNRMATLLSIAGVDVLCTCRLPAGGVETLIAVHEPWPHAVAGVSPAAQMSAARDPLLIVSRDETPDLPALERQIRQGSPLASLPFPRLTPDGVAVDIRPDGPLDPAYLREPVYRRDAELRDLPVPAREVPVDDEWEGRPQDYELQKFIADLEDGMPEPAPPGTRRGGRDAVRSAEPGRTISPLAGGSFKSRHASDDFEDDPGPGALGYHEPPSEDEPDVREKSSRAARLHKQVGPRSRGKPD